MAPDTKRYYPFGNFAAQVLGFVGSDNQGLAGIEAKYDSYLTGTPGRAIRATNANGEEMPFDYEMYYEAEDGNDIVLTIDEVIQHYLEKNLEIAAYDNNTQNQVAGIVMDVDTGAILGMATKGDFDPNDPFTITDERRKSWDFSTPYYTDYVSVLVEDASGIKELADLKDKVVGVSSGSTSARALVQAMIEAGVISGDGFDADTFNADTWKDGISFRQYDDYPAISTALSAGEVNGFCVDKSILAIYKTDGRSYIDAEFSPQEYGIATKKGSGFSALCDELVTGWLADGTIDGLIKDNGLD